MLSFKKSKVITKLTMGFLVVSCIGAFIGINGILKAGEINDLATQMYEKELLGLSQISEANVQLIAAGRAIRNAVLANDDESRKDRKSTRLNSSHYSRSRMPSSA